MADHKAARERAMIFLEEKTETVSPGDLPILDECPICLDTYTLEQPMRIKVEGCTHVFGRSCLTAMLTNNPRLDKKCPLCRTVWMAAPAGASASSRSSTGLFGLRSGVAARQNDSELFPGRTRPRPPPRANMFVFQPGTFPSIRPHGVINLVDSDDDEDPQASFNAITRDITDVRERARNTQLTRRQRKEEKKQNENANANANASRGGVCSFKRENDSANTQNQADQQAQQRPNPGLFHNPPTGRSMQLGGLIQRNWGLPNAAARPDVDSNASAQTKVNGNATNENGGQTQAIPLFTHLNSGNTGPATLGGSGPSLFKDTSSVFAPGSLFSGAAQQTRRYPNPFILSPSPESDAGANPTEADRVHKERLDQREKEHRECEMRMNTRERGLDTRERMLNERDRTLFQREQRVAQREQNEIQGAEMRQRQLHEVEAMVARHREETRRL